jgi:hypothetical protein
MKIFKNASKPWHDMDHYRRSVSEAKILFADLTPDDGPQYTLRYVASGDKPDHPIAGFLIQMIKTDVADAFGIAGPDTIITGYRGIVDIYVRFINTRRSHVLDNRFLVTVDRDYADQDQLVYYGSPPRLTAMYWAADDISRYGCYKKVNALDISPLKIGILAKYSR